MNRIQLEYALALKKYGNYSRAAQHLGISQPGLSLQIKNLEVELGIILFDRKSKPLAPTFEGEKFLEKAVQLINQFNELENYASTLQAKLESELTIGIIPTLAPYLVPLFISELKQKYSDLKISITEITTDQVLEGIRNGELNVGIIATPIESFTKYETIPLFYEGFQIFVSEQHPLYQEEVIDISKIDSDDLWLLSEGNCFRDQVNNICGLSKNDIGDPALNYKTNNIESLCRIVEFQGGVTFIPELSTLHIGPQREDLLKPISKQNPVREISLVYLPNTQQNTNIANLAEVIKNNIPSHMLERGKGDVIKTDVVDQE